MAWFQDGSENIIHGPIHHSLVVHLLVQSPQFWQLLVTVLGMTCHSNINEVSLIFCNSWKIYLHYQIIFFKIIVDISHGKDIAGFDDMLCSLANAIRTRECTKKVRNISCAYMIFMCCIDFACACRQSYPYFYSSSEKPDDDVKRKYTSDKIFTYQRPRSRRKRKSVRSKQPLYSKHGYSR